jgi:hypothetical protein
MKKAVLSVGLLFSFYFSNAQDLKLKNEFRKQRLENEKRLDEYFLNNSERYSNQEKDSLKSRLAGFTGVIPIFYSAEETGANATANVDELQNGTVAGVSAITGNGVKITIFDEGRVHETHEQFTTNRVVNKEASTLAKSAHTTNVTGIIVGNGTATGTFTQSSVAYPKANAKGVLPQAITDNYLFSTTALGDKFEKLSSLSELNISNHSYGANNGWNKPTSANTYYWYGNYDFSHLDTYSGTYGTDDSKFDKIVYSQPQQIIIKSTGNYFGIGPAANSVKYRYDTVAGAWVQFAAGEELPPANCSLGYNCIGYGSLAKNIITVGAVNQLTTTGQKYTQSTDVVKYSSGSAGPRKDGAVKPDLVAVGVDMIMPNYTSNSVNTSYLVSLGTSYSAAVVSGIAGALTQVQRNLQSNNALVFKADEMKALLTHTANEAGRPGPDVWYGWGLVDAKKAAQVLVKKLTEDAVFNRNTLQSGNDFTKEVQANGTEPLKVSISWVDPAAIPFTTDDDMQNNHASRLVNDLDLRVVEVSSGTVYYPWKLDVNDPTANATKGDNAVDNVEQVVIDNPTAEGIYRIEVGSKNFLVNQDGNPSAQDFALVATGIKKIVTMAVNDLNKEEIKIYPTRTKDIVKIELQSEVERIAVFDTNGKLVLETNNKAKSQTIDLNKFPSSVYIITVKTKSGIISKKIIKE